MGGLGHARAYLRQRALAGALAMGTPLCVNPPKQGTETCKTQVSAVSPLARLGPDNLPPKFAPGGF
jgi:hypothetical protein